MGGTESSVETRNRGGRWVRDGKRCAMVVMNAVMNLRFGSSRVRCSEIADSKKREVA